MTIRNKTLEIFDTTLREGAQTPYVNFSFQEKKDFLKKLFKLGVDFAEVGYPITSEEELREIQSLARLKWRPILSSLGRARVEDIYSCEASNTEVIDIDLGISPNQLEYLKLTLKEAYIKAFEAVSWATKTKKRIKFAALDVPRTSTTHITELYGIVSKAGAEWFTLCDTVGISNPDEVKYIVKKLKKVEGCKLSVHYHNDFDMASSNTVTAALAGVEQLEITVNGLGDRAGIAPLAPVVTYLKEVKGYKINIDLSMLRDISNYISRISKIKISPLDPIVGEYCFKHSPGIHVAGVLSNPLTFEPISPEKVGQVRGIVLGRYSGRSSIKSILRKNNIDASERNIGHLTDIVKSKTRNGGKITEKELLSLVNN